MRALFTQLSLLVAIMTTYSLRAGEASTWNALLWGALVGCTTYLVLLLGDYAVHKLLEDRAHQLSSVRFVNGDPSVSLEDIDDDTTLAESSDRELEAA